MRAMWSGVVAFGLVSVPVKLYAATEDHDVHFHQVHTADGGRVKMVRTCSIDGEKLELSEISSAFDVGGGEMVVMSQADFDGLPVAGKDEIEVLEFVPADQVDPVLFDRSYYLEPEPRGLKPYVLLREALQRTDRTALVRVVLRTRSQLAALRVRDDVLVLQTLLWPDEVRAADFPVLAGATDVRTQEIAMAESLVESLSGDFDPRAYRDEYREALVAVIDAKAAGGATTVPTPDPASTDGGGVVLDLMEALRESVARSRDGGGAAGSSTGARRSASSNGAPAKKRATAAKKAPAKKSVAKEAPAKKSVAKEAPAKKTSRRSA